MLISSLSVIGYLLQENVTCASSECSQQAPVPRKLLFDESVMLTMQQKLRATTV